MIIAVASGKGGVGKTTVSTSLALTAGVGVRLLDCDVEEPDCHLILPGPTVSRTDVELRVPEVDPEQCDGCAVCSSVCRFHAIAALPDRALVFPGLCHGCGGCTRACPSGALHEVSRVVGEVEVSRSGGIEVVTGRLGVGEAQAPPVIRAVRRHAAGAPVVVVDAPPGTSCPMITAVRGADAVILVAEPTAFGLADLELAVTAVRQLALPFGVVVNRAGLGDGRVVDFCRREEIPVLLEIPFSRVVAERCSRGESLLSADSGLRPAFASLWAGLTAVVEEAS